MKLLRFDTVDGHEVAINVDDVVAVTPAVDGKGITLVGAVVIHTMHNLAFPVKGSLGTVCQAIESGSRVRLA